LFKKHSSLNIVWVDDHITAFHDGREDHHNHAENIDETIDSIVSSLDATAHAVKIFYEGRFIEQHVEECPNIKSNKDIEALVNYKIHTGKINGIADIAHVRSSYMIGRSTTGRLLLINILQKEFINAVKEAFKRHGIAVDMISSMTHLMAEIAKEVDCTGNFILLSGSQYNQTNSVLYFDGGDKQCHNTRVANAYRDVNDMKAEIEHSLLFGMQLFEGEKLPIYAFGQCASELADYIQGAEDADELQFRYITDTDVLAKAASQVNINDTANFIPKNERKLRAKRRRGVVVLSLATVMFIVMATAGFRAHEKKLELSVNKEINANLLTMKHEKERQLSSLQNKIAIAQNILHGQSDAPCLVAMNICVLKTSGDIRLTKMKTRAKKGYIDVELEGLVFGGINNAQEYLKSFSHQLTEMGIKITQDWKEHWLMDIATWQQTHSNGRDIGIAFQIKGEAHHAES